MDESPGGDEKVINNESSSPDLKSHVESSQVDTEKHQENSNNYQTLTKHDQGIETNSKVASSLGDNQKFPNKLLDKLRKSKEWLIQFFSNLSKKQKIIVSLIVLVVFINVAALVVLGKIGGRVSIRDDLNRLLKAPISTDTQMEGKWKRLEIPERDLPFFTLKPTTTSRFGILPQEQLILSAKGKVDSNLIKQHLISNVLLGIKQKNDKELIISPQSSLGKDEYLKVKLAVGGVELNGQTFDRDYSWAFQTQGKFRVVSHIPGDKKTKVPLNAGIEFTFSQDDFKDASQFIQISPSFLYKLEVHDETLAIIPQQKLKPKTIYTVKLKKGLNLKSRNDPIAEDFEFSFQTDEEIQQKATSRLNVDKSLYQVSTQESLKVKVFTSSWKKENKVSLKVFKFPSAAAFLETRKNIDSVLRGWYSYYPEEEEINTDGLELISQTELEVLTEDRISYLQLPDTLSGGYYYLKLSYEDQKKSEQVWLNVSDIAGYVAVGKNDTTIWLNNVVSGAPVSNANVSLFGTDVNSISDGTGVVFLTTPSSLFDERDHYFLVNSESSSLVLPVSSLKGNKAPGQITKDDYWAYLYNERLLYHPTDTVYYWGVVKRRNDGQVPEAITLALDKSSYSSDKEGSLGISQVINPQADGSFMGSFSLKDIPDGYYYLYVRLNDVTLDQSGFRVKDFVKPEMKIEAFSNKKAVFTDEKVEFTANVSFYDDTPASDIPLKVHETDSSNVKELKTDVNGQVKYVLQPQYYEGRTRDYQGITVAPALVQESKIEGNANVLVFGNKLMITTESEQDGYNAKIKATINRVDLNRINSGTSQKVKGGTVANHKVHLKITKKWYEKISKGTYYDYIEKVTRPAYEYKRHSEEVFSNDLFTNEQGLVEHPFNLEVKKSYEVVITTWDEDGHMANTSRYFYYRQSAYSPEGGSSANSPQLVLTKEENVYSLGEIVEAKISLGDEEYPDTDNNRFLFIVAQRGTQQISVQDSPNYNFQFSDNHIPNVSLGAVIFTGKVYKMANPTCRYRWSCHYYYDDYYFSGLTVLYKKEDKELILELGLEKNKYKPGERAKVIVKVNNKQGSPVSSSVNLVLVDEALEALRAIRIPSILSGMYRSVSDQIYFSYYSHKPALPDESGAEMGGGGGERELFKDTAFFGQQTTNEQGETIFEFDLPDNITTWRMYAQAVTNDLQVGQETSNLVVSKDFFVLPQFPRTFLNEDKPLLIASSFGVGVDSNSTVNYQAEFFKNDEKITQLVKDGKANSSTSFAFPDLGTADYSLTLNGKTNNFEDGVKLPFLVTGSNFILKRHQSHDLKAGDTLSQFDADKILTNQPIRLIISDEGKGKYYSQIRNFCYTSSNRIERKIVANQASHLLDEKFDDSSCKLEPQELSIFQYSDGGLSLVRWGGSHLETTVWATFVDASSFDRQKLIDYYIAKLREGRAGTLQRIQASWGLITLDQPAINTLNVLSEIAVTFKEKVFIALAYASAGEVEKAREIYLDILADYAYTMQPYIRVQEKISANADLDAYLKDSSLALLLGSMVLEDYDKGLYAYIRDYKHQAQDVVIDLSQMAFIEEELEKLPDEFTQVKYQSPTQELTRELTKGGRFVVNLTPAEKDNFSVNVVAGKAEVTASYFIGKDGLSSVETDERLKLTRTYENVKNPGKEIKPGDIVKVRLDFELNRDESPKGSYLVSDLLPAGLSYLNNPRSYGLDVKLRPRLINKSLQFRIYNSDWWFRNYGTSFEYYARVSGAGGFVAEPALFQSTLDPSVVAFTQADVLKIATRNE